MCLYWCGVYGDGDCHSHSPLMDHAKFYRVDLAGPLFSVRDIDLFQDNFPTDGTTTGTVRIDAAIDRMASTSTNIYPGETNTPIVDQRPSPPPPEKRAQMLQPEDIAACVVAVAKLPPRAVVPELVITPPHMPFA